MAVKIHIVPPPPTIKAVGTDISEPTSSWYLANGGSIFLETFVITY
jgi:hypothetical protein